MDISNIQSGMHQFITDSANEQIDKDEFQDIIDAAIKAEDDEGLRNACREFESYYLQQTFNEMRNTIPEGTLTEKSHGRDIFEDMLYEEYAKASSQGQGVGIAQMLFEQLSKNKS